MLVWVHGMVMLRTSIKFLFDSHPPASIFTLQMDPIHLAQVATSVPAMMVPGADVAWKYFL
jgi:hypothetical protein